MYWTYISDIHGLANRTTLQTTASKMNTKLNPHISTQPQQKVNFTSFPTIVFITGLLQRSQSAQVKGTLQFFSCKQTKVMLPFSVSLRSNKRVKCISFPIKHLQSQFLCILNPPQTKRGPTHRKTAP